MADSGQQQAPSSAKTPADFLKSIKGKPVIVKLNSGVDYRGESPRGAAGGCRGAGSGGNIAGCLLEAAPHVKLQQAMTRLTMTFLQACWPAWTAT